MKIILSIFLVFCLSLISANPMICDQKKCGAGQMVICADNQEYHCVILDKASNISITLKVESTWEEKPWAYTSYRVVINNNSFRTIKQLSIETDNTLKIKDQTTYWNIVYHDKFFYLPSHVTGISKNQEFEFGFVNQGVQAPYLKIRSITF